MALETGQRVRIPGKGLPDVVTIGSVQKTSDGLKLYVEDDSGAAYPVALNANEAELVKVLSQDGAGEPGEVLAGLWSEWMCATTSNSGTSVLPSTPLRPYAHQSRAVYGAMLPQPSCGSFSRTSLAPGRQSWVVLAPGDAAPRFRQPCSGRVSCAPRIEVAGRLRAVPRRPASLRRITADTVREHAVGVGHDMWVVSLELQG